MKGILTSLDRDKGHGQVRPQYDDAELLIIYFDEGLPNEIHLNCTVEFDVVISKKGNKYAKFVSVVTDDISSATAIRKLYYVVAPATAYFSLKIVDGMSENILDELAFSKNDDAERTSGEERLECLLKVLDEKAPLATISCEIKSGLGNDYMIRVYVGDWQ